MSDSVAKDEAVATEAVAQQVAETAETAKTETNSTDSQQPTTATQEKELGLDSLYQDSVTQEVPENYDLSYGDMKLSSEETEELSGAFRELGLNNEKANKALNMIAEQYKEWRSEQEQEQQQLMVEAKKQWQSEIANDAEIGGQNLGQTKQFLAKAMQSYGSKDFADFLNLTGLGYNPHFVKFMAKIGKALSSDTSFVGGQTAPMQEESPLEKAKRRYPNSPELW